MRYVTVLALPPRGRPRTTVGRAARGLDRRYAADSAGSALDKTDWAGVAMTVSGLLAVAVGGWILWRQATVAWSMASKYAE